MDWILGGDDEEGLRQWMGVSFNTDLIFLHGFQQRALGLGGCAVDFIGQHHLVENGAGMKGKGIGLTIEDHGAQDIGGQQIAGELDSLVTQSQQFGQGMRQGGFTDTGNILNQ